MAKEDPKAKQARERAASMRLGATPASNLPLPMIPPAPGSAGFANYLKQVGMVRGANATPEQEARSAATKRAMLDDASKSQNKKAAKSAAKKNAIQRALSKFRGKGKPMGIPGGDLKNLRR